MALSGFYAIDGTVGAGLNVSYASGESQFVPGTTVRLNDNRVAIYLIAGQSISVSAQVAVNTSYTASASAGGWIALGGATSSNTLQPGDLFWARTSATVFGG